MFRVKITEDDLSQLRALVFANVPNEAAAFALAGVTHLGHQSDILVRRPIPLDPTQYRVQNEFHLEIAPKAVNGLIALCEANGLGAILCHSHPGGGDYSPSDDFGEHRILKSLRECVPGETPTASLL